MKKILPILLLLLFSFGLHAGTAHLHFNNISTDSGLSNKMVLSIAQDSLGFIWMGTSEGLNRYDGVTFKVFTHVPGEENSLGSSWINAVLASDSGNLLIGTEMGLDRYDPETESISHYEAANDTRGLLQSLRVRCLYEDEKSIWVGTSDGLIEIDRKTDCLNFIKLAAGSSDSMANEVKAVTRDCRGRLWVGTYDGLYLFNESDYSARRFDVRRRWPYDQENNYISSLCVMPRTPDRLYVGTANGLAVLDVDDFSCRYFRAEDGGLCNNDIKALGRYSETSLLVGTADGLSVFDLETETFDNYTSSIVDRTSLPHETIWSMTEDKLGIVWLGTGNGVAKINKKRKSMDIFRVQRTEENYVRDIMVTDLARMPWGDFWLGTNSGIRVCDDQMRLLKTYSIGSSGLPHNVIKRIMVDSRGTAWVGTNDGLTYYDRRADRFVPVRLDGGGILKYVYDVKEDSDGDIVVNMSSGICIIHPETDKLGGISGCKSSVVSIDSFVSSVNTDVTFLSTDSLRRIWFGTINDGLFCFDRNDCSIVQFCFDPDDPQSINSNRIYTLHVDACNAVWVGTDMGLCRLDPDSGKFTRFADDMDLSHSIRTITSDSRNRLWLCSSDRIIMYDYEFDNKIVCDVAEDLDCRDIEYNSLYNSGGDYIYFGGYGGVIRLAPKAMDISMDKAPVRITGFSLAGTRVVPGSKYRGRTLLERSVTLSDQIVLSHDQNTFSISFALMNYASVGNNRYMYMLNGFDRDWISVSGYSCTASYSSLNPGTYEFIVKGCNPDDVFSDEPARLVVKIKSPWWASIWALTLYLIATGGLLFAGYTVLKMRWHLMTQLRMEKLERAKMESLNKVKMNFFTNISHEFKTPLSLIIGPVESLLETAEDETQRSQLQIMKQNAKRMLRLINEILDLKKIDNEKLTLKTSAGEIVSFAEKVFQSFADNAERRNITYDFIAEEDISCTLDWDKVEKIIYNLLSNAFKYTPDMGSIQLIISRSGNNVNIVVADTGQGIPGEDLERIFDRFYQGAARCYENVSSTGIGLGLAREFVQMHGGTISVESSPGAGSRFTVTIPRGAAEQEVTGMPATVEGQRPRVVVIDDNEDMLTFIRLNLSDSYEVHTAHDGGTGLELVANLSPAIVICDVMMPDMDGYAVCQEIKGNILECHIPVILLTAKSGEDDKAEGYRAGADCFISKPFTIKVLRARMESLIESRIQLAKSFRNRLAMSPSAIEVESEDDRFMSLLVSAIEKNMSNPDYSVQDLCEEFPYSYLQIYRKVKALAGCSINELIRNIRLKRAAQYLEQSDIRVSEIIYNVGFNSHSYFTKCFREQYGMSPKEYAAMKRSEGKHNTDNEDHE